MELKDYSSEMIITNISFEFLLLVEQKGRVMHHQNLTILELWENSNDDKYNDKLINLFT